MKKMIYGNIHFTIGTKEKLCWESELPCSYDTETIRYAAEQVLSHSRTACADCALKSWRLRFDKAKAQKKTTYLTSAEALGVPDGWIAIRGKIDASGLTIERIKLFAEKPSMEMLGANQSKGNTQKAGQSPSKWHRVQTWSKKAELEKSSAG